MNKETLEILSKEQLIAMILSMHEENEEMKIKLRNNIH